jgi:hypothetical protein
VNCEQNRLRQRREGPVDQLKPAGWNEQAELKLSQYVASAIFSQIDQSTLTASSYVSRVSESLMFDV